jgi:glyoxylase-like metal-dependent hydrolase (beta-lactamase superfamily II)
VCGDEPAESVEEVRPGIWSIRLPMPGPLAHVFVYVVAADEGVLLVDAGWDSEDAFAAFTEGLHVIGIRLTDVQGVLVTHAHPDHLGLVNRIRRSAEAWMALHSADLPLLRPEVRAAPGRLEAWLEALGVGEDERPELAAAIRVFTGESLPRPDRFLTDGDGLRVRGGDLIVMHTPGHSPGHVCFVHRDEGVIFAGDHVLSEITPNISIHSDLPGNPLGDYQDSLARVRALGDLVTLPGHERRVPVDSRAAQLLAHHEEQLRDARAIVASGSETVREVAERMTWSESWESLGAVDRYLAMGEALAHLVALESRRELVSSEARIRRWRATQRSDSGGRLELER